MIDARGNHEVARAVDVALRLHEVTRCPLPHRGKGFFDLEALLADLYAALGEFILLPRDLEIAPSGAHRVSHLLLGQLQLAAGALLRDHRGAQVVALGFDVEIEIARQTERGAAVARLDLEVVAVRIIEQAMGDGSIQRGQQVLLRDQNAARGVLDAVAIVPKVQPGGQRGLQRLIERARRREDLQRVEIFVIEHDSLRDGQPERDFQVIERLLVVADGVGPGALEIDLALQELAELRVAALAVFKHRALALDVVVEGHVAEVGVFGGLTALDRAEILRGHIHGEGFPLLGEGADVVEHRALPLRERLRGGEVTGAAQQRLREREGHARVPAVEPAGEKAHKVRGEVRRQSRARAGEHAEAQIAAGGERAGVHEGIHAIGDLRAVQRAAAATAEDGGEILPREREIERGEINDLFLQEIVPVPVHGKIQRVRQGDDARVFFDVGAIPEEIDRARVFREPIQRGRRRRRDVHEVLAGVWHLGGLFLQKAENLAIRPFFGLRPRASANHANSRANERGGGEAGKAEQLRHASRNRAESPRGCWSGFRGLKQRDAGGKSIEA